ncbi:MAG: hypothetical protein WD827_00945 [Solirubrobacterales bacterium]
MSDAVVAAAGTPIYEGPKLTSEANLVWAISEALRVDPDVRSLRTEYPCPLKAWTRNPGGIDLAVELSNGSLALLEMKVDKPDEALWDALKLADFALSRPDLGPSCFLIYDGAQPIWARPAEGAALFTVAGRHWSVRELIERWPTAWLSLMIGGRGIRPQRSVADIRVDPLLGAGHDFKENRILYTLQVAPMSGAATLAFDSDGWPVGYKPPKGLREKGQRKDRERKEGAPLEPPSTPDPCHGYPWYARWTRDLIREVAQQSDGEARECLRNRLIEERRWTDDELADCGLGD